MTYIKLTSLSDFEKCPMKIATLNVLIMTSDSRAANFAISATPHIKANVPQ